VSAREGLLARVRGVLPRSPRAEDYLALLERRLEALEATAAGAAFPEELVGNDARSLAESVLQSVEGAWDDGDEAFVGVHLDGWGRGDPRRLAQDLARTAESLARAHSRPGTLFFFLWQMESFLPEFRSVEHAPADNAAASLLESESSPTGGSQMAKRILVVDDDENILNLERTILEQKGFDVTGASGGAEALKLLAEKTFDLVLLDVMMPEVDGFAVCRKIKEDERLKDIPVIFLTAKGGGEALAEGFESGAVMYINKPFTANKLLTIVHTMLDSGSNLS
jgi:CheY-like chemotaxis protein